MPTYEYLCTDCGHEFETFQSMKDDPLTDCPSCEHGTVRRKIGLGAGIIFKGSGFYETDFKDRKGTKPSETGDGGATTKGDGSTSSEGKKESGRSGGTDAKPAAAGSSSSTSSTKNE